MSASGGGAGEGTAPGVGFGSCMWSPTVPAVAAVGREMRRAADWKTVRERPGLFIQGDGRASPVCFFTDP
ncbi:hypothetical protein Scel_53170 [Streptomyces cellostaticus]|nr:hypothetical protein Scel_53170 [Streptomyces cellostaticus]